MSFGDILTTVFLGPIKLLFEVIFAVVNERINDPGVSIICLSLAINVLVLPLYMRADVMQKKARDKEMALKDGIAHIKKTFSGDERMMILQTYYRQNDYSPFSALQGSTSLLLQIPFFMAAVQVLSALPALQGASLGPISDLGAPDGLLVIGGISINLLPVLMTAINFISSALFSKDAPLKTKVQLYGLAIFFLVFLYNYPAGLVFYWLLNNLFSLVKTIFYKLKNPKKVLSIGLSVLGVVFAAGAFFLFPGRNKRITVFVLAGVAMQLPLLWKYIQKIVPEVKAEAKPDKAMFLLASLLLTVFTGILIPSAVISSSPQEFLLTAGEVYHPVWFIVSAGCYAVGTFLVWMRIFYWLASEKGKVIFARVAVALCAMAVVSYMCFNESFGMLTQTLQYEWDVYFEVGPQLLNLAIILAVAAVGYVLARFKAVRYILLAAVIAFSAMTGMNVQTISVSVDDALEALEAEQKDASFVLSKDGENVVVIMLDRAIGPYLPYLIQEKPELKELFAGFTYYSNTLSYSASTSGASPSLFGGYEYTPVEMNKRDEESLASKHNEAHMVMPQLFADNGFQSTVVNPVYLNYQNTSNLAFFDDYPGIRGMKTQNLFLREQTAQAVVTQNNRNFFVYSLMKALPTTVQPVLYNEGLYNHVTMKSDAQALTTQVVYNKTSSYGYGTMMEDYSALTAMPEYTVVEDSNKNTFLLLTNNTTHNPQILQLPDYVPALEVDNSDFDIANQDYYVTPDGKKLSMQTTLQVTHYHANMAALLRLGDWLNYLRENDIYDNTRIILVADHGRALDQIDGNILEVEGKTIDLLAFKPLLMVKDFGATEFAVSDEFMTIADVPVLATKDVIENPVNPFTQKPINSDEKYAHDQFVVAETPDWWDVSKNNGDTYWATPWLSVSGDINDLDNWNYSSVETVLKEHVLPQ